jgi:ABC-2 type transport system ATP-binding protein
MIVTHGLTKRYGNTVAVDDLSFSVTPGVVTGFLGPNGSGKSTTMRMILGLDLPDGGTAYINGSAYADLSWPLREVGALLDAKAFHPGRTARNHLRWLAQTNDIPLARVDAMLDLVGLTAVADKRAGKFSLGMGQRLGIASALIGDPGVLLFDEPVNGLDPEGIRWVRHLLRDLAAEGRTVLVSSHLINEMALTAERLVVIGRGTLIAETSVDDFVARHQSEAVRIVTPTPQRFVAALAGRRPARRRSGRRHCRLGPLLRRHRPAGGRPGAHRARAHAAARLARGRLHGAHERVGRIPRPHQRTAGRRHSADPLKGPQ